jgi:alginate O-acetyltransferase complex protein AlgI
MLFNSFQFLAFFLVVSVGFLTLPDRRRLVFLLIASYYFYMCWSPRYITVIWFITIIDDYAVMKIEEAPGQRLRVLYLGLSIVSNFGLLFVFKYAGFAGHSLNALLKSVNLFANIPTLHFLLPIGISFHTFQAVSYTVEVYRGRVPAERSLLHYALYVSFFAQMVAGPIERPYNLIPQFHQPRRLELQRVRTGLELAMWGMFKKVVVADRIAVLVNVVYARPSNFSGPFLALATVLFAIQIYCDFSGYSDMAIGLARIMGFDLMVNFREPYFSQSIAEFWRRWHISLSSWFRDYLYIPLGGNRVGFARWCANIMIVFTLSGLWHGANWTFVIWGALHGVYYVVGRLTAPARRALAGILGEERWPALWRVWRTLFVFGAVTVAWVFFRAQSVGDALYVLAHLFRTEGFRFRDLVTMGLTRFELGVAMAALAGMVLVELLRVGQSRFASRIWEVRPLRWTIYYACVYCIIFFGVFERIEFIYFRF